MTAPATHPMQPASCRIQRVHQETDDTFTLDLVAAHPNGGFHFLPGQFNMIYVFGVGEVPISISGDPDDKRSFVHTTRAVGAVTKAMRKLKKGDTIGVRGPFGTSWPVAKAEGNDVLFVAGGIGFAPLRPAIYHVLSNRDRYGKVVLLYGTRSPGDILFRNELEHWRSRLDFEVFVTVDRAHSDWKGNVGVVTGLIAKAPFDPQKTVAMVCGPEMMMKFTMLELEKRGLTRDKMFLSLERNMKCGIGLCGHCQLEGVFVCKDGPVFEYTRGSYLISKWEV